MDPKLINADNYPIGEDSDGNDQIIRLLPVEKVKKLPNGTKLVSIIGKEITIGEDELDLETHVFGRSKYGELNLPIDVVVTKKETNHGKPEKSEKKRSKKSG